MLKRLLPTLLGLGAGFAALTAFLVVLELVFLSEDRRGAEQEAQNRLALESYASVTLQRTLRDDQESASERVERVLADPLLDDTGLVLVSDGVQVLPRVPGAPAGVAARYEALVAGREPAVADQDDPWGERLRHLELLRGALEKKDKPGVEHEVRFILQHRTRWLLPPAQDLPLTLAMLELLTTKSKPSAQLVRAVLRDGLTGETPVEGLERQVLRAWPRLGPEDLSFLCAEVARQALRAGVEAEEFSARCSKPGQPLDLPQLEPGLRYLPVLRLAVRATASEVRGGAANHRLRIDQLTTDMQIRGLLDARDTLDLDDPDSTAMPFKTLHVQVNAPRFASQARERGEALRLKTALLVVTFVLGGAIVAVALVAQRRKFRFVELKSDFVSTVSHELRTPLASLRLMAETLERKLDGHEPAKDYPHRIVAEVDSLAVLVENILSFNRIDKGRWAPRLAPWRLEDVKAVLEEDARRYPAAKVELSFSGLDGEVLIADGELMRMLFQNLLRNACKYNARDPVRVSVHATGGRLINVRISDNGVGIPADQREAVFEAFHRVANQGGRGGAGSGLGLALCRKIAELHGGTLRITDSSPEGTTFELVLPPRAQR